MLVQLAFFMSYAVFAFPSGKLVEWIGYKRSMVVGLLIMAVGALCFIPAANVPSYPLFLGAEIVLAAGVTLLQVSANPFVSVLGPERTASSRLNLTQAFNSLGTTVAPWVGGALILSAAPKTMDEVRAMSASALQQYRLTEAATVKMPYVFIAVALVALASPSHFSNCPGSRLPATSARRQGEKKDSVFHYPHLLLGAVAIFLYVGAEVSIGSFLVNYFSHEDIGNMTGTECGQAGFALLGRRDGWAGSSDRRCWRRCVRIARLGVVAIVACTLVSISILSFGHLAVWSILAVGLFNSIMFPTIFTLGLPSLGR